MLWNIWKQDKQAALWKQQKPGCETNEKSGRPQEIFVICWSADCHGMNSLDTLSSKGFPRAGAIAQWQNACLAYVKP